jgi:hypothetical protein
LNHRSWWKYTRRNECNRRVANCDSAGNIYYYFTDQLGSTRALTNSTGAACYHADFTPFGSELTPGGFANTCGPNYRFSGYEYDSAAPQLYYAAARYYSPSMSRFLTGILRLTVAPDGKSIHGMLVRKPDNAISTFEMEKQQP